MKIYRSRRHPSLLVVADPRTRRGWWLSSGGSILTLLDLENDWDEVVLDRPGEETVEVSTWGGALLAVVKVGP